MVSVFWRWSSLAGRQIWLVAAASLVFAGGIFAQKPGAAPSVSPLNIPSSKPSTNNPLDSGGTTAGAGMYVDGKVMVQDGGELPLNVVIQKVCGSRHSDLGYADRKGYFSVRLNGNNLASLVDASDDSRTTPGSAPSASRQQGGINLLGCTIEAVYPGYRSASINIGSQRLMDNPNIGTLIIRRIATGSGTMVSQTLLTAPKNAAKAYEQGMDSLRKGNLAAASKDFEKAVGLHPSFANAWYELGHLNMSGPSDIARADLTKAVVADSKYVPPYIDLAIIAYRDKNWQETVKVTDQALHLDSSGSPELYYYNAAAQFNLRNMDEAERKAREAIRVDSARSLPRLPQLLSFILASKGDYVGAAEQMSAYIASGLGPEEAERARKQLAALRSKAEETAKK